VVDSQFTEDSGVVGFSEQLWRVTIGERHRTPQQVIRKLAEDETLRGDLQSIEEVARHLEISVFDLPRLVQSARRHDAQCKSGIA
jgi:hypothetical protein